MGDATAIFSIHDKKDDEIHAIVQEVYDALKEKGYNPVNQLVGYILSEDPTYITTYKGARSLIRKVDRADLLQALPSQSRLRRASSPKGELLGARSGAQILHRPAKICPTTVSYSQPSRALRRGFSRAAAPAKWGSR